MKALVTGASSGIGKDIAKYLSKLGYDLIITATDKSSLEELASELKTKVKVITLDLSIKENVYKLYELTKDENIDVLINNAGFGLFGDFNKTDLDKELAMINVNIVAFHILAKLLKDTFCKYKTMKGYRVLRKIGWDTHGLPVEVQVEKELGFNGKNDIEKYGIKEFNEKCRESVWKNEKAFSAS